MDVVTAVITLISSLLGGGVVAFFLERHQKKVDKKEEQFKKEEEKKAREQQAWQDHVSEGLKIGLENDAVIFKALREHKINGESELQEQKMNEFFRKQFTTSKKVVGGN